jgi:hypothetical protein
VILEDKQSVIDFTTSATRRWIASETVDTKFDAADLLTKIVEGAGLQVTNCWAVGRHLGDCVHPNY